MSEIHGLPDVIRWVSWLIGCFNIGAAAVVAGEFVIQARRYQKDLKWPVPGLPLAGWTLSYCLLAAFAIVEGVAHLGEGWTWRLLFYPPSFIIGAWALRKLARYLRHRRANLEQVRIGREWAAERGVEL